MTLPKQVTYYMLRIMPKVERRVKRRYKAIRGHGGTCECQACRLFLQAYHVLDELIAIENTLTLAHLTNASTDGMPV